MSIISRYRVRKAKNIYRKQHPSCEACGRTPKFYQKKNEVHRIQPEHAAPHLAEDPENMVTLCRHDHFWLGHCQSWTHWNANVLQTIAEVANAYCRTATRMRKEK